MLESAMYAGIGFLTAAVLMLMFMPFVHERAVRLTTRRLQSATPPSVKELHAQRDLLRAEYAMKTRRLKMCVAEAKAIATSCRVELGRKAAESERFKIELIDATDLLVRLHAQQRPQRTMTARQVGKLALYMLERSRRNRKAKLTPRSDNIEEWTLVPARF